MICVPRSCCAELFAGHKDVKKDGDGAVPEHKLKAYELGFEILKSVDGKFP